MKLFFLSRKWIFDPHNDDPAYNPLPEDERPGGFAWGEGQRLGVNQEAENQDDPNNRQQGL